MEQTRVVLIRHGEAQSAVEQRVGGHSGCNGLSDLGRRQAEALRDRLARSGELRDVTALYSSVLPRAVETARIIAPSLGDPDLVQDCELCELHPGDEVDGMRWDDVRQQFDLRYSTWHPWVAGAESWAEFVARVGRALTRLASEHAGGSIAVACHGGIVDSSFSVLGHAPLFRGFELLTMNTSITEWVCEGDPGSWPPPRWRLIRYNDAAHLVDVD